MRKAIIIIARNEMEWTEKTSRNFKEHIPDAEIIGIDDGGENHWPEFVRVHKTQGGEGVGNCRRYGVNISNADLIMLSDGHVYYNKGSIDKAWELATKGYVVNPSVQVMGTNKIQCGRKYIRKEKAAPYVKASEGKEVSLIGSVYFMNKAIAMDIVAPTPGHGSNELIMTCAAMALGHKIYALPELLFEHMYKRKFNYPVTYQHQCYNRELFEWWFFNGKSPGNVTLNQKIYYNFIQKNRIRNPKELEDHLEKVKEDLA